MDIEFTPTPGSNNPPSSPSIFAVNPGQNPNSRAWSGDDCYEPHWEDNGEAVPEDAECYRGRFTWMEKVLILFQLVYLFLTICLNNCQNIVLWI